MCQYESYTQSIDLFGASVALSGNTLVVGAPREASSATGVGGNQNDNTAGNSGAVYVFKRTGNTWAQEAYVKASNAGIGEAFGMSVAVSGETLVVGAPRERSNATGIDGDQSNNSEAGSGAAYLFVRSGATWSQRAYIKASNTGLVDDFTTSIALSGITVVFGAKRESSNATGINGDQSDNSATYAGAVYVRRIAP